MTQPETWSSAERMRPFSMALARADSICSRNVFCILDMPANNRLISSVPASSMRLS
jgi:hypothetical protein